jgi:hypothetical protein
VFVVFVDAFHLTCHKRTEKKNVIILFLPQHHKKMSVFEAD